jgi:hypothetical protein
LDAIDPDGGPYIDKGYKISFGEKEEYIVKKISNINFDEENEYLELLLHTDKLILNN